METKDPIHIFIVADKSIYLNMLDYIFNKDFTHRFYGFATTEECLKNLHMEPELVIVDSSLPGSVDSIKAIKGKNDDTHLIALVAEKDELASSGILDAGANDTILHSEGVRRIIEKTEAYLKREAKPTKLQKTG